MQLATIRKALRRLTLGTPDQAVLWDADELVRVWAEAAYTVAANLSWREDMGLVYAAEAGHWDRVRREIGLRQGWQDGEPEADFAANVDRAWLNA